MKAILTEIETLESKSDPKCYATASRLEDFIYGTPLTDQARFAKNVLQKKWAMKVWLKASELAEKSGESQISVSYVKTVISSMFTYQLNEEGHWTITFLNEGSSVYDKKIISKNDKRQYGSIAYSLRAILAVQQESLMDAELSLLPLTQPAINALNESLDLYTLAALSSADQKARISSQHELTKVMLLEVWASLDSGTIPEKKVASAKAPKSPVSLDLLRNIIDQKVRSFEKYNDVNNQIFVRNLQVYFARNSWPKDPNEAKLFKQQFTETLILFTADLYKGAEQLALANGHNTIKESDVKQYLNLFIPHEMNAYEDALFFPKLPKKQQVFIESYDFDSFRDSGIHWSYLRYALLAPDFKAFLEPDPFAVELLAENVAQFGVLLLRVTGQMGKDAGEKRIKTAHFEKATRSIQNRINQHALVKDNKTKVDPGIVSANNTTENDAASVTALFTDATSKLNIDMTHHSSDWLNRLLRSYLRKDEQTGIITIPPAFGGSGIASDDINNDGLADLLILSGSGNRLYINRKDHFEDVTEKSGLTWLREQDKRPGEPRQPLIADINNDGLQDIIITYVDDTHRVYKNTGNGTFVDVTEQSGLGGDNLVAGPATVFDYDNDGLLDIYISYFGDYIHGVLPTLKRRNNNGLPNKLFRNLGDFKFQDVTEGSGLADTGWGQAVAHTDFDSDGRQDLIVGNDFGVNGYYRNLGDGKFINVARDIGTDKPSYTMGIGITDLNDDLVPDIYISNIVTMNKDQKYVLPNEETTMAFDPQKLANMRVIEANDLFVSSQDDQGHSSYYASQAVTRGRSSTGWAWDADFFDFDNDGDDDLYVLNGMNEYNLYSNENPYYRDPINNKKLDAYIPVSEKESNVFFINEGGKLQNRSEQSGANLLSNSRSATYLDYDQDGDLDMFLNNYHGPVVAFQNNSEQFNNNWLNVKLTGSPKDGINRDAIGAKIIAELDNGERVWREVHGSSGYMSVHPKTQHLGLGKADSAVLTVIWPNGKRSDIGRVNAQQLITVDYSALN
ncbi:CRTAC1 family protein [Litoribacillus peritrichatus]